jgi:Cu/Ag efflux pump CusA
VRKDVQARLAAMKFPLQYHAEILTASTSSEIGATSIIAVALAALLASFLLLQAALRSWSIAALTFLTLPAALVGGLLAALVYGTPLSLGALLGLLGALAIAVRGGIVLVSRLRRLEDDGSPPGVELVQRACREQFGPLAAAALATAVFLLPFAVLSSRSGLEIVGPMATVMLGGLLTATAMSLLVLPALIAGFAGQTDRDPAEDLLHAWVGAERPPSQKPVVAGVLAGSAAASPDVPGPITRAG